MGILRMDVPRVLPKGTVCVDPQELGVYIRSEAEKRKLMLSNPSEHNILRSGEARNISSIANENFEFAQFYRPPSRALTLMEQMRLKDPYFANIWEKYEEDRALKEENERTMESQELERILKSHSTPSTIEDVAKDVIKFMKKNILQPSEINLPDPWKSSKTGVKIDPPSPHLVKCVVNGRFLGVEMSSESPPVGNYDLSKFGQTGRSHHVLSNQRSPSSITIPKSETSPAEVFEKKIQREIQAVPGPGQYNPFEDKWQKLSDPTRDRRVRLGIVPSPSSSFLPKIPVSHKAGTEQNSPLKESPNSRGSKFSSRGMPEVNSPNHRGMGSSQSLVTVGKNGAAISPKALISKDQDQEIGTITSQILKKLIPPEYDQDPGTLEFVTERLISTFSGIRADMLTEDDFEGDPAISADLVNNSILNAHNGNNRSNRRDSIMSFNQNQPDHPFNSAQQRLLKKQKVYALHKSKSTPTLRQVLDSSPDSSIINRRMFQRHSPLVDKLQNKREKENSAKPQSVRMVFDVPETDLDAYGRKGLLINEYFMIRGDNQK
eukprot:GDKJ01000560.1.p1 GENE.GDKJ01000560.1~~GDKJ01000560.1.p1  ORF type:complete len:548 (+),score=108.22 GDKJ01000560.1:27-1670(+)